MRLAIVCPYSFVYRGGVQDQVIAEAVFFSDSGHDVVLLAPDEESALALVGRNKTIRFIAMGKSWRIRGNGSLVPLSFPLFSLRRLTNELNNCDIVHMHEPFYPFSALLLAKLRKPVVATFHAARLNHPYYTYGRFIFAPLLRKIHSSIAVSPLARQTVTNHFPGKITIIPNGIELAIATRASAKKPAAPYILFIGRNEKRKGLPVLVEAFGLLKHDFPGIRLKVIGSGFDQVRDPQIDFLGNVSPTDKFGLLSAATAFCAPSLFGESFGIVLLEAMAACVPVVASNISGYNEVIQNGKTGLLFEPGNPAALASALGAVLGNSRLRERLRKAGKLKCRQYDWKRIGKQYAAVFSGLLSPADARAGETG